MKDAFTIYKLIILYIMDQVNATIPQSVIENFILDQGYTNYFNLNQALAELSDTELIFEKPTHNTTYYGLTDAGKETIHLFYNELAKEIRTDITEYLKENRIPILEEISTFSDYTRIKQNEYMATCSIVEKDSTLIELKLNVSTEKEAKTICDNWKLKNPEVYENVITLLLKKNPSDGI